MPVVKRILLVLRLALRIFLKLALIIIQITFSTTGLILLGSIYGIAVLISQRIAPAVAGIDIVLFILVVTALCIIQTVAQIRLVIKLAAAFVIECLPGIPFIVCSMPVKLIVVTGSLVPHIAVILTAVMSQRIAVLLDVITELCTALFIHPLNGINICIKMFVTAVLIIVKSRIQIAVVFLY